MYGSFDLLYNTSFVVGSQPTNFQTPGEDFEGKVFFVSQAILSVAALHKSLRTHWTFRTVPILRGVSFDIFPKDIFGFLGKNGAGKTTTIKTILGLLSRDGGEILFEGTPLIRAHCRSQFGYLPELPYFYDHLSVEETLFFLGSLAMPGKYRVEITKLVESTLTQVGLLDKARTRVKSLSKGLQQRLGLAQAIINSPRLLFLDEPFSGLDPVGRAEFREILLQLNATGTSILISSHILADVEALCNRVGILSQGTIKRTFVLSERAELFGEKMELTLFRQINQELPGEISNLAEVVTHRSVLAGFESVLRFANAQLATEGLERAVVLQREARVAIREFRSRPRSLEDIFLDLTSTDTLRDFT